MCFERYFHMIFLSISYFREEAIATSVNALDHYVIRGTDAFSFRIGGFWYGISSLEFLYSWTKS
jgi:hypothetical protein